MCTLKVRTESGKNTLIVKLQKGDRIAMVYEAVRDMSETGDFEIASNFPKMIYTQNAPETLEELGFWPNAALHMKKKGA